MAACTSREGPPAPVVPFFLNTDSGRLFAVFHRPSDCVPVRGNVLCVPPFNEEMNRCRSMITQQARALARLGMGTLLIDLLGTGDSTGEFVDARWPAWRDNLIAAQQWLQSQPGGCTAVWGIRLGAILAAELHARLADAVMGLVLWQPVIDGKTHLTQFMRVKIAAQMDRNDLPKESTASMREAWARGDSVEIAGYEIHPALADALDAAKLQLHRLAAGSAVLWLEQSTGDRGAELGAASQRLLAAWPGADVSVAASVFQGPAFWHVHERVLAPDLIERTTAWFDKMAVPV